VSNVGSLLRIDGILPSTSWESNLKQQLKKWISNNLYQRCLMHYKQSSRL
jgi:hypothetical protein